MRVAKWNPDKHSLKDILLLASLSSEEHRELELKCSWREFDKQERILEGGDDNTDVFFLVSGQAHVLNYSGSGRIIEYATLYVGDVFGEYAAIDGLTRSAWVMALTPCVVAVLPGKVFVDTVIARPEICLALLRKFTGIIRLSDERMTSFSHLSAEQRVCLELIRLAERHPESSEELIISLAPTQRNLAHVIGTSRETVARIISQLRREGIIEYAGKTIHIRKRGDLENLALF